MLAAEAEGVSLEVGDGACEDRVVVTEVSQALDGEAVVETAFSPGLVALEVKEAVMENPVIVVRVWNVIEEAGDGIATVALTISTTAETSVMALVV